MRPPPASAVFHGWKIIGVCFLSLFVSVGFGFYSFGACFGRRSFGRVMGLMSPMLLPIQILGVPFAGYVFDRFGSYDLAFTVFISMYVSAMLILALLRLPKQEPTGAPPTAAALGAPAGPRTE